MFVIFRDSKVKWNRGSNRMKDYGGSWLYVNKKNFFASVISGIAFQFPLTFQTWGALVAWGVEGHQ